MGVNFLGLNSSFDSANLVSQLVQIETTSKIKPLETKRTNLTNERSFLQSIQTKIKDLRSTMNIEGIGKGTEALFPRSVTSSDTNNQYVKVTATDQAIPQTFNVNVTQLATNTVRKSATPISTGVTGANVLNTVSFKSGTLPTTGTVTINGETQTSALNPAVNTVTNMLNFFNGFTGVTATLEASGKVKLSGVTSIGGAGDTSNILSSLGLDNAQIVGNVATGIQNIDAPNGSTLLTNLGINGTNLTINGTSVTFAPATDTVNDLIKKLNTTPGTNVNATFDALNGQVVLTNKDTGAISLTASSTNSNVITQLKLTSETLGNNAEFTVSTLNGGATLVSNDNTVSGLIQGVTLDLKQATAPASPVKITIGEDKSAYKDRVNEILDSLNSVLDDLDKNGSAFSKLLSSSIKNTLTTYFSGTTDTFKSGVEVGISSVLGSGKDGNGFGGFKIDGNPTVPARFDSALTLNSEAVNTVLFGKTDTVINPMSNGKSGVFVLLDDLLNAYDNPGTGILSKVIENVNSRITTTDADITRAEDSVAAYEDRLRAQFSQLDVITSKFQGQQQALNGLLAQLDANKK